ncbi:hypothetical protein GCM10011348_15700 [Marinobacterium nitratireducens]|uniref:DUF3775 domain-containing protein n=1 Tax=Marinobacterium nitratireducens TaxID=518897 RepID=A0A917ZDM0_9GAMM|nr:DUF3775 domain-containing protein [Marinobacterium nitratireducens]GGO79999.1 hypothetical protein GCM10011348_15700 [Marinobacterium nitratireducens]
MLNINPETVCQIIQLAREFHAKEEVVIPETPDSPADDWGLQVLADHSGDLSYQFTRDLIAELELDQQVTLVALMWLGRGDFGDDDWKEALMTALDERSPHTAEYLLSTPLVADYLEEGLRVHGYGCEEPEDLRGYGINRDSGSD